MTPVTVQLRDDIRTHLDKVLEYICPSQMFLRGLNPHTGASQNRILYGTKGTQVSILSGTFWSMQNTCYQNTTTSLTGGSFNSLIGFALQDKALYNTLSLDFIEMTS